MLLGSPSLSIPNTTRAYDQSLNPELTSDEWEQHKSSLRTLFNPTTGDNCVKSCALSAENYISITGTSRATATRDLVEKGALTRTGEFRYTRRWLKLNLGGRGLKNGTSFLRT